MTLLLGGGGEGGSRGMTCESYVIEARLGFEDGGVVCGDDGAVQEEQRGKKIWDSQSFL